jgi:hypothetical protein
MSVFAPAPRYVEATLENAMHAPTRPLASRTDRPSRRRAWGPLLLLSLSVVASVGLLGACLSVLADGAFPSDRLVAAAG